MQAPWGRAGTVTWFWFARTQEHLLSLHSSPAFRGIREDSKCCPKNLVPSNTVTQQEKRSLTHLENRRLCLFSVSQLSSVVLNMVQIPRYNYVCAHIMCISALSQFRKYCAAYWVLKQYAVKDSVYLTFLNSILISIIKNNQLVWHYKNQRRR